MKTKLAIILTALLLAGCEPAVNYGNLDEYATKHEGGISYKIVTIERRKFIAVQDGKAAWVFAGPIDR